MVRNFTIILTVILVAGCQPAPTTIEISFVPVVNNTQISCTDDSSGFVLTDLRFYLFDGVLTTESGSRYPIELIPDNIWQSDSVALLDFEDGQGGCANGSQQTNTAIRGKHAATEERLTGVEFQIGVPLQLNHENPLLAEPPLNHSDLHWHWASGYKFLSTGVANTTDGFWLHLGSSRCKGTIGNIEGCLSSNRPTIRLTGFDPALQQIHVDLGDMFAGVDLADGTLSDCSSGADEYSCAAPFRALGLSVVDGTVTEPAKPFRTNTKK